MGAKQTAVVVIPTYNEADSIQKMIEYLFKKIFPSIKNWELLLLIVDDTSPDGTYKIVQKNQKTYRNLKLLLNPNKAGIGNAYVKGFKYAMKHLNADVVIEFDGDFQHPPETIPQLLKQIDKGYDYILGSRKLKGGSNPKGWGFKRVFFSEVGGFVARFILFFPTKSFFNITDPTTGLKASRVKGFVDQMDMDNLYSKSFGYKLEFLFKMVKLGAKIKEIPLKFKLRQAGKSKISSQTAKEIFKTVIFLRLTDPTTKKFIKFGTVGFLGFVINAFALEYFNSSPVAQLLASQFSASRVGLLKAASSWAGALAAELAIISNFILNNFWTFSSDKITNILAFTYKFIQFNLTSIGAVVIQFAVIGGATLIFSDTVIIRQLALIFSVIFLIVPYNWIVYNKIIWRNKK